MAKFNFLNQAESFVRKLQWNEKIRKMFERDWSKVFWRKLENE